MALRMLLGHAGLLGAKARQGLLHLVHGLRQLCDLVLPLHRVWLTELTSGNALG